MRSGRSGRFLLQEREIGEGVKQVLIASAPEGNAGCFSSFRERPDGQNLSSLAAAPQLSIIDAPQVKEEIGVN
jgi:hypothetical protein